MTQQHTFKVGDVVRLKSASPPMVIDRVNDEFISVVYVGYTTHIMHREMLHYATLRADTPPSPAGTRYREPNLPPWES